MKTLILFLTVLISFGFGEKASMVPDGDISIQSSWWGESFQQKGSDLSVSSMYPVLDAYQGSRTWAKKSRTFYIPSFMVTGAGIIMMVIPPASLAFGNKFQTGMFIGGAGFTTLGLGFFKLSNVYLGKAVREYKKEAGSASLDLQVDWLPGGGRLVGIYSF